MDDRRTTRPRVSGRRPPQSLAQRLISRYLNPRFLTTAAVVYGVFLIVTYTLSPTEWMCPSDLDCEAGVQGYFWDSPITKRGGAPLGPAHRGRRKGHILEQDVGQGLLAPESCSKLCQDVPDCAFWMYTQTRRAGLCKLWAVDQSPCVPRSTSFLFPIPTVRFKRRGGPARQSVVGGPCRIPEVEETPVRGRHAREDPEDEEALKVIQTLDLRTSECPHLECARPTKGFLFDHEGRGHLKRIRMPRRKNRGYDCHVHCRLTDGCSFWMADVRSKVGQCTLWTREQSPCEPTDPFDSSTAHYVESVEGGGYVIGGNCHRSHKAAKTSPHGRSAESAHHVSHTEDTL